MATAREMIEDSLTLIGVASEGNTLSSEASTFALRVLNRMLSSWSVEIGQLFFKSFDTLNWTAGQQSQTIGTGGDLNTVRPIKITGFQTRKDDIDYTLAHVSFDTYQMIFRKDIASDFPDIYHYNKTFPLGTIFIYPVPSSNISVRITSYKALANLTLDDTISLPEGYEEAIMYNLAPKLAPKYGRSPTAEVSRNAANTKMNLTISNLDSNEMWPDYLAPGNIYSYDYWRYIDQ